MAKTHVSAQKTFEAIASENMPILQTVMGMQLDTLENCSLDERSYNLVRLAALVAVNAPPASYMVNIPLADEAGVTLEDVQGVFVAIAPVVGSPRLAAAAGNVLSGLEMAEALAEEE